MAEYRTVRIGYWGDPYIENLSSQGKLVYLYLITSCLNNLGILELSKRKIAFDTSVTAEEVENILAQLERDKKIARDGDNILLMNFVKHQTSTSPMIIKGLKKIIGGVTSPKLLKALAEKYPFLFDRDENIPYAYPMDMVCIPYLKEEEEEEEEVEGEDKGEEEVKAEEEDTAHRVSVTELIELWNATMPQYGFARAKKSTPDRRTKLRARQKFMPEANSIDFWKKVYYVMANSPLCRGELSEGKHKNWKANFDFPLLSDTRINKITEGEYDDTSESKEWVPVNDNTT